MDKNKRSMKDKVEQLFEDYRLQQKTLTEVKAEILRLLDVVGQSELLVCKGRCDHGYKDEFGNELFCSIKNAN